MVAKRVRPKPDIVDGVWEVVRLKADTTYEMRKPVRSVRLQPDLVRLRPDYFPAGTTAMASISSSSSGRARWTTCTSVLAGGVAPPKYFVRTSRIAGA